MNRERFGRRGDVLLRIAMVLEVIAVVTFISLLGELIRSHPGRVPTAVIFGLRAIFYCSLLCVGICLLCIIRGPKRIIASVGLVVALLLAGTSGFLSEGDPVPVRHSQIMGGSLHSGVCLNGPPAITPGWTETFLPHLRSEMWGTQQKSRSLDCGRRGDFRSG
jgi:hypothetical protein